MATTTTQLYELRDFSFQDGTTLPSARLAYLDINRQASKAALVITCFRGKLKTTLNFSDGALRDHRIIVVSLFGNGESSSPSNTEGFPGGTLDYRDCVRAQKQLVTDHLNIPSLDVVVGFSMGGQCTYHWTLMYPDLVRNAVIICSSARTSRHNYQFLEGPKTALQNAVDYVDKGRAPKDGVSRGLRAFGKCYSAWLTSAEWFDQQAYQSMGYKTLSDWDRDATGEGYAGWDPDDLLAKLGMWQRGDVTKLVDGGSGGEGADEGSSLKTALSRIEARVLLMPCETDQYFRPAASEREAVCIPDATLKVIPSIWGHIAGGGANKTDTEWMDRAIAEFLATSG